jgi:hypothetical protein
MDIHLFSRHTGDGIKVKDVKDRVHPRTGHHEGTKGEYMYSSTLSLTSALDGDGWSTSHTGRVTTGKDPVPSE